MWCQGEKREGKLKSNGIHKETTEENKPVGSQLDSWGSDSALRRRTPWGPCQPNLKCCRWGSKGAGLETWFGSLSQGPFQTLRLDFFPELVLSPWSPLCLPVSTEPSDCLIHGQCLNAQTQIHTCAHARNNFEFQCFLPRKEEKHLALQNTSPTLSLEWADAACTVSLPRAWNAMCGCSCSVPSG